RVEGLAVGAPDGAGVYAVTWNSANRGTRDAVGGFQERVSVRNLTTGATLPDTLVNVPGTLAVNATLAHTLPLSFTVPGTYLVTVTTDSANNFFEFNANGHADAEQNNTVQSATFSVALDLQVTAASAPASAAVGESVSVSYMVQNAGTATATADWTDRFYLSADQTLDGSDLLLG